MRAQVRILQASFYKDYDKNLRGGRPAGLIAPAFGAGPGGPLGGRGELIYLAIHTCMTDISASTSPSQRSIEIGRGVPGCLQDNRRIAAIFSLPMV